MVKPILYCISDRKPPFAESVIEALILLDLFRTALDFDPDTSRRGVKVGTHGKADIVLHLRSETSFCRVSNRSSNSARFVPNSLGLRSRYLKERSQSWDSW